MTQKFKVKLNRQYETPKATSKNKVRSLCLSEQEIRQINCNLQCKKIAKNLSRICVEKIVFPGHRQDICTSKLYVYFHFLLR